eukprot:scaffold1803_cov195-Alexandrium_tamarense.AAC.43
MPTDSGNSNSGGNNNLADRDGGEHASIGDSENDAAIAKMLQDEWNNEDMPMHSSDDSDGDEDNSVDERKTSATRNLALAEDIEADLFSEGTEHEEDEADDTTDKEIAQAKLQIRDFDPGIINYDKSLELCCIGPCLCECATDKESCDEVQIKEVLPLSPSTSSNPYYVRLHRRCCRNLIKKSVDNDYGLSAFGLAMTTISTSNKKRCQEKVKHDYLKERKLDADNDRAKYCNDSSDPIQIRSTDERYLKMCSDFRDQAKRAKAKANVLSLFSGIGSGILALKRLNISIGNLVVVEHDSVAEAVCSSHHNNESVASYHWMKTFEELEGSIDAIMAKYGRGPPCVEYSAVNAYRQGVHSEKGSYMLRFAKLVTLIRKHQQKQHQQEQLYFLCENVPQRWDDQGSIETCFGISPVLLDAQTLSPAKRKRSYYTNIPSNNLPDSHSPEAMSSVCLADGWMTPSQMHCYLQGVRTPVCKSLTFLASSSKIDDERMVKVKIDRNWIVKGYYSVADREVLMGFPRGYVEEPGELALHLFIVDDVRVLLSLVRTQLIFTFKVNSLFEKLSAAFRSEDWTVTAGDDFEMLTHYSGRDCKFVPDRDGTVTIKVCTVEKSRTGKPLYYFDREEYAKRLIGNSYSIPAVEHLLLPLQDIFHRRDYSEANYRFEWVQADVGENI